MDILLSKDALQVPSVKGKPYAFDMRRIHKAEGRLVELAGITSQKAGELLFVVIEAFGEAKEYFAILKMEFGACKQKLRSIRGTIVLDRAPEVLKTKGLASARSPAGSEDLRDSVVNTDPEYLDATDKLLQVEAAMEHMEGKYEKLKMAYYSISDLMKTDTKRSNLSGGVGDDEPGTMTESEKVQQFVQSVSKQHEDYGNGFGPPKL